MKILKANSIPSDCSLDTAFVLEESSHQKAWAENSVCLQVLTNFGARYKKVPACETSGKVTQPFQARAGNEPAEKFFSDLVAPVRGSIVDISEFAANWMTTSWMFGVLPKRTFAGLPPNSAGCFRALVYGELDVYTFSTVDFLSKLKQKQMVLPTTVAELEQARGLCACNCN